MPILSIRHRTHYSYHSPVSFGEHRMMFRPIDAPDQTVIAHKVIITPNPIDLIDLTDPHGNRVAVATFGAPARSLTFESFSQVVHEPAPLQTDSAFALSHRGVSGVEADIAPRVQPAHPDPDGVLRAWAAPFASGPGCSALRGLSAMSATIGSRFQYRQRLTGAAQAPRVTLARGTGSCRDFAVLMMEAARSLGLPARFVSGYILCGGARERRGGGHTHAWTRVRVPGEGWVDFDPTNGATGGSGLIRVAVVRDPTQALPLHGCWYGEAEKFIGMDVEVDVTAELTAPQRVKLALTG